MTLLEGLFTEKQIFTDDYAVEAWELGYGTSRFAHKSTCNLQCMPWTPVRHSSGNAAPAFVVARIRRVRRCGRASIVAQNCFCPQQSVTKPRIGDRDESPLFYYMFATARSATG